MCHELQGKIYIYTALAVSLTVIPHSHLYLTLTAVYKQTLTTGHLPDEWLEANSSPVFKKGSQHEASNYGPITLTSVCCKTLEHILCSHIRAHLDTNNILSPLQHRFRKHHSCESQLLITINNLMSSPIMIEIHKWTLPSWTSQKRSTWSLTHAC